MITCINKHFRRIPIVALVFSFLLLSCIDFDDATQAISVKVQLQMPTDLTQADLSNHTVTLTLGGQTISAQTDAGGIATFQNIVPDVYDIAASWKMTANEYGSMTGETVMNGKYTVSGSLSSQMLSDEKTLTLNMSVTRDQSMIIGKVYYAGSKDTNNKNYIAGKYIELYNNSDESQDVSGLYIALMESESTIAYTPGQIPDTVVAKQVFRIPTYSQGYSVQPGGTVLLVNSAIDHRPNGELERNLLDADFEAKDMQGRTTNNPDTPALELVYTTYPSLTYLNLVQSGPCSIVIFSTDEDVANWPTTFAYGKTKGNRFMKIPTSSIIDGIEILQNKAQTGVDANTKRLFNYIDAGYTYINATNGYNGETVCRKTESVTPEGRRILVDTNNSQNDFTVGTDFNPREYK